MRSIMILLVALVITLASLTAAMRVTAQSTAKAGLVTFNKDVLPILQKNCQVCHRPGEIAPMSFMTYGDTRPWAKAMKTAVIARQMPPWFADPGYGHFKNDRRLSEEVGTMRTVLFVMPSISLRVLA